MRVLSIDAKKQTIEELELEMHVNTMYTFFGSILIDEIAILERHMIYTDANALCNKSKPFFIGGMLVLGDALVVGREALEECDATITQQDLSTLVDANVNEFYTQTLELLAQTTTNLYRPFTVVQGGQKINLNIDWVLYTFNIADDATKKYFIHELKKVIDANESVENYMTKMAQLAINAAD